MSTRKVVVQSPQKLRKGEPPRDVTGVFGGVRFERGVSEAVEYGDWAQFAARGNACLRPEEADRLVKEARARADTPAGDPSSEEPHPEKSHSEQPQPEACRRLTPATLKSAGVPEGYVEKGDVPGYQEMLNELSSRGVAVRDFFGGQPRKGPLVALYFALEEGVDALLEFNSS